MQGYVSLPATIFVLVAASLGSPINGLATKDELALIFMAASITLGGEVVGGG